MLVYHNFRGDIASQIGTHACPCAEIKTARRASDCDTSYCRAQMRAGSSSGAKECHSKYQRLNKALVRILTRFVVRRAPVAPLCLASRLTLHRHRLRIMRGSWEVWCVDDWVLPLCRMSRYIDRFNSCRQGMRQNDRSQLSHFNPPGGS